MFCFEDTSVRNLVYSEIGHLLYMPALLLNFRLKVKLSQLVKLMIIINQSKTFLIHACTVA